MKDLWDSASPASHSFSRSALWKIPDGARRYLEHAIAPSTPLASAVRLRMHGEIKLKRWLRFSAEQVISWGQGFIWKATVWMGVVPIVGSDRLVNGEGAMRWKLLGIIPMMLASGADITRSAVGRIAAELVWLPSALLGADVVWSSSDSIHARAELEVQKETVDLGFTIDGDGRLKSVVVSRWGNPGGAFSYVDFGGIVEAEGTFGGYTIPTRLRVGYYIGTPRFESEGEFIRIAIDEATFQ